MKKLFIVSLLMVIPLLLFSETGTIKEGCNLRDTKIFKESKAIGSVAKGTKVEVLSSFADYGYAEVKDKKTQKKYKGYIWQGKILKKTNDIYIVTGQGLKLSKYPRKPMDEKDVVARIWPGSEVRVIKWIKTWYEIYGTFGRGWVYKDFIDVGK